MPNQEILEGLKSALARGYSLKIAMQSFYNAGYPKKDIENAARALQYQQYNIPQQPQPLYSTAKSQFQKPQTRVVQRVSGYEFEQEPKKRNKLLMVLFIIILIVLIGALTSMFLFKEQILDFIGKLMG